MVNDNKVSTLNEAFDASCSNCRRIWSHGLWCSKFNSVARNSGQQ